MARTVLKSFPPPSSREMPLSAFESHRVLLLNADYRPMGFPLVTLTAPQVVAAVFLERVNIVRQSDVYAHSPTFEFQLPSIVSLKQYINVPGMTGVPLCNRHNLFVRDRGHCLYTGKQLKFRGTDRSQVATIDHVVPISRGGVTDWKNCVLSSMAANVQKGNKLLALSGVSLIHHPWTPTAADLLYLWLTDERLQHMDEEWLEFLLPNPSPRVQEFLAKLDAAA